MKISCPDFAHNQMMPKKFTCQGRGVSPALIIEDIPKAARSLVLIVDDPDAPEGTFVHWVVYNILPQERIEEGAFPGKQGLNSMQDVGYCPACPPSGTHRYFFKIYALSDLLSFSRHPTKEQVVKAMKGSLLESAECIGLYKKS